MLKLLRFVLTWMSLPSFVWIVSGIIPGSTKENVDSIKNFMF